MTSRLVGVRLGIALCLLAIAGLTSACASASEPTTVIVDVRTVEEFTESHLEGAVNIPFDAQFPVNIAKYPITDQFILYCRTGNRSGSAAAVMLDLGYTTVLNAGSLESAASLTGAAIIRG